MKCDISSCEMSAKSQIRMKSGQRAGFCDSHIGGVVRTLKEMGMHDAFDVESIPKKWRDAITDPPVEGADYWVALIDLVGRYRYDVARWLGGEFCNDNWHCGRPPLSGDKWMEIQEVTP